MDKNLNIFATDLDRTLIYSNRAFDNNNHFICVEHINAKEITYMTQESISLLHKLKEKVMIIPVTTRSIEQFKRVTIVSDSKYAITSNGGTILKNGKILKEWKRHISQQLKSIDFNEPLKHSPIPLTVIDDVFYYAVIENITPINEYLSRLPEDWHWTIQGKKLYIIPKIVSKENALRYLISLLNPTKTITAGDGQLDINFITLGDLQLVPEQSEAYKLLKNHSIKTIPSGIDNVPKLLNNVLNF